MSHEKQFIPNTDSNYHKTVLHYYDNHPESRLVNLRGDN